MWRAPEGPEGTARPASALGLAAVPVGVTPIRVENVYSFGWKMYNALHIRGSQEIQKQAARFELLAVMPWVAAGPGCGARGRLRGLAEPHISTPGATGVEGAGGSGGHGRASRRGTERSEVA